MSEESSKKSGKFFTTIIIGGALGSLAAILLGRKKRQQPKENNKSFFFKKTSKIIAIVIVSGLSCAMLLFSLKAEDYGRQVVKEKQIQLKFDAKNPEGNVDLKKIAAETLGKPEECTASLTLCQIGEVTFDIVIRKKWTKLNIPKLSNYEFANAVPTIKSDLDHLSNQETVVLQEALARRGLLEDSKGNPVKDRGYFGSLTWVALTRLAHIKGLDPKNKNYKKQLTQRVNEVLQNMAKTENYVDQHPLPPKEQIDPKAGDKTFDQFQNYKYLSDLAESGKKINPGDTSVEGNTDVTIDGFVNVERIKK